MAITINTTSKKTADGEIIDPTTQDIAEYNSKYETVSAPASITSASLKPATPFKTTPVKPASGTDGALAYLGAQSTQYAADLQQKADIAKERTADIGSSLMSLLQEPGKTALTSQAYEQSGVNTAETELKDINNQILAEQVSLQRQVERLEKNEQGLFGQALNQEIQRVKDMSLKRQADLSVIQMAKQGRFDSAKTIADRAVAALTEARQNRLEALQFMYAENKDLFTKAEQRAFEVAQGNREGELQFERQKLMQQFEFQIYKEKAQYDQKLQQSDPMYKLQMENLRSQITERARAAVEKKAEEIKTKDEEANAKTEKALGILQLTQSLSRHPGLNNAVGTNFLVRKGTPITGEKQDFVAEASRLANILTLDNMKLLKGPASDRDVAIIANASSKLTTMDVSQASYRAEIQRIEDAALRITKALGITGEQATAYGLLQPDDIEAVDSIYGVKTSTAAFSPGNYY